MQIDTDEIEFVIEQDTPQGLWQSDPRKVKDKRHVRQVIIGGFLHGQPRRAVAPDGKVLFALDAKGHATDQL